MPAQRLQAVGIGLLILTVILLFVGWQQYQSNLASVEMMNRMLNSTPMGVPFGQLSPIGTHLQPGTPTSTQYAVFFAVLTGIGGIVCLLNATSARKQPNK